MPTAMLWCATSRRKIIVRRCCCWLCQLCLQSFARESLSFSMLCRRWHHSTLSQYASPLACYVLEEGGGGMPCRGKRVPPLPLPQVPLHMRQCTRLPHPQCLLCICYNNAWLWVNVPNSVSAAKNFDALESPRGDRL